MTEFNDTPNNDSEDFFKMFISGLENSAENAPKEASGDMRVLAGTMFSLFASFVEAGFSEDQALQIVLTTISVSLRG